MLLRNLVKTQIIKSVLICALCMVPFLLFAQTNYFTLGTKDYNIIDRLEIKTRLDQLSFSVIKPYPRKSVIQSVEYIDSLIQANDSSVSNLTATDKYDLLHLLMANTEWSKPREAFVNPRPFLKSMYKNEANLLEVNNPDFFMVVNPVVAFSYGKENSQGDKLFLNTRGVSIRGMISKKIGFYLYATENQERDPLYVQDFVHKFTAVPGVGFYKNYNKTGYDYFDARGAISWNIAKFIDMQFGYDKNSIGAGYRSLFLSDFSNSALFVKINTRIWKLNYENLFFELYGVHGRGGDDLFDRKYARINHLSVNATKWLNVGLFESVVFGRKNHFDFQYMLPVMFIRPAEQQVGSKDNAMVGLDAKANLAKKFQVYGSVLLDEFVAKEIFKNHGFWANKFGYQLGVKYIDAFGVDNLDIQVETNRVRPFTYSHFDSVGNYTHYNQPLAHPLGANFQELIAIVKAQPLKKLYLQGKIIHYFQGLDSAGVDFGSNPFIDYGNRPRDYGFNVGSGDRATCNYLEFLASYELIENLFIDLTATRRTYKTQSGLKQNSNIFMLGVRWNIARRVFDF